MIKPRPDNETCDIEKPSPILPNQESCILKRSIFQTRQKWKPKEEYKVGDLLLVDKDLIPVRIHGKVGNDYYYIAKLNEKLWPEPVKLCHITSFLEN